LKKREGQATPAIPLLDPGKKLLFSPLVGIAFIHLQAKFD
jgi:hypothetical protein